MNWTTRPDISEYHGFIYLITNTVTDQKYIGKKSFWSTTSKLPKGKLRRVKTTKESNWKEYTGSCVELNEDIASLGKDKFTFEIIKLAKTKGLLGYCEMEEQIQHNVLRATLPNGKYAYYNSSIGTNMYNKKMFIKE